MEMEAQLQQSEAKVEKPEVKTTVETKEDHIGVIAELARSLGNVSPSGA